MAVYKSFLYLRSKDGNIYEEISIKDLNNSNLPHEFELKTFNVTKILTKMLNKNYQIREIKPVMHPLVKKINNNYYSIKKCIKYEKGFRKNNRI